MTFGAFAGHESSGGGGDGYLCKEKSGKVIARFVDTFETLSQNPLLHTMSNLSSSAMRRVLSRTFSDLALPKSLIREYLNNTLHFREARPNELMTVPKSSIFASSKSKMLPDFNDDNIFSNPDQCEKFQLGIQSYTSNVVVADFELLNMLSPAEQELFYLHENLIRVRRLTGDTTPIRDYIALLIASKEFETNLLDELQITIDPTQSFIE